MYDRTHYDRMMGDAARREIGQIEQASRMYPLPKPKLVNVRVLVPFMVAGKPAQVDDTVTLPDYEADGQVALKRAERV